MCCQLNSSSVPLPLLSLTLLMTFLLLVKSAVTGSVFCLETENVEAAVVKAVAAGAVSEGEISIGG
ncbi:hypothetical protein CASFOL_030277 [Castilleja foliolosa]|uniref:Glyoxalase At5g48480-like C-terminal domain-containing protein n=1 Tax=Castilleja foliolosa TaxID=1961234 RepID=A0ABD3C7I9_9LAMI